MWTLVMHATESKHRLAYARAVGYRQSHDLSTEVTNDEETVVLADTVS